jgi:hypothetical protein
MKTFDPAALSLSSDSYGYMLFYRDLSIGGAGVLRRTGMGRNGATKAADIRLHRESAERELAALATGGGQARFRELIQAIDKETP